MKIATWNVNSIRQREAHVRRWLERARPDILVLQEIKCETAAFPAALFEALGYRGEAVGQKAYNGVAVLARVPFKVTHRALPGLPADDAQARYIELVADGMTVIGVYVPNGNSGGEAGFAYKLAWLDRLRERAALLLDADTPLVIAGDFNVCPTDDDYAPGALSPNDALLRPESRARFRRAPSPRQRSARSARATAARETVPGSPAAAARRPAPAPPAPDPHPSGTR